MDQTAIRFVGLFLIVAAAASAAVLVSHRQVITNVSAVEVLGSLGIFWDANCTKRVSLVEWGNLTLGSTKQVLVYVRNEDSSSRVGLRLTPRNWLPAHAAYNLAFSWRSQNSSIGAYEVVKVALSLYVPFSARGVAGFSFDIVFEPLDRLLGDVNGDGIVNMRDVQLVVFAYSSTPSSPKWNANADQHPDSIINMIDMWIVLMHLGEQW